MARTRAGRHTCQSRSARRRGAESSPAKILWLPPSGKSPVRAAKTRKRSARKKEGSERLMKAKTD